LDEFYKSVRAKFGVTSACRACTYKPVKDKPTARSKVLKWVGVNASEIEDPKTRKLIMDYHREREWRRQKKAQGLCTRCGEQPLWNSSSCTACALARAQSERERKAIWVAEGLCKTCGQGPAELPTLYCSVCITKSREGRLKKRKGLRDAVFEKYGQECACCGITGRPFLTIDHINEDGAEERRKHNKTEDFLRKLLKDDRDDIQILCWNCNLAKHHNGGTCPHEYERQKRRDAVAVAGIQQDWMGML
jgi:hypothetical protein